MPGIKRVEKSQSRPYARGECPSFVVSNLLSCVCFGWLPNGSIFYLITTRHRFHLEFTQ